jgi:hypothetical protein
MLKICHNTGFSMLKINHNAGFFSTCSIKLLSIIGAFNNIKRLPNIVDSSEQFSLYKGLSDDDITFEYFEHYDNINTHPFIYTTDVDYKVDKQFFYYKLLAYNDICPFIQKFFSPSTQIQNIIQTIETKYNIDYTNICVLFYRGNDKITETELSGYKAKPTAYDRVIEKANQILSENPNILFLIQSDETEFIDVITQNFPSNSFYFKDETRHMNKQNSSVDLIFKETNLHFSKLYLAITIIMSKCKYVVCGSSGNCSIWITFYRGNADNVYQYLENVVDKDCGEIVN